MRRSEGAGGATGCTANAGRCAVEGCFQTPKPQVCPYDGSRHGHGAIHYWSDYPKSALVFREGDWFWICDEHYRVCCEERSAFEEANRAAR